MYLDIGHGMLGWTLALGSARRLADLVASDG
jgi:D-amino-acid dehydrogenase